MTDTTTAPTFTLPTRLSYSSIAQFGTCEANWHAERNLNLIEALGPGARKTGIVTHEIIAAYLTELASTDTKREDAAYAACVHIAKKFPGNFAEAREVFDRWRDRFEPEDLEAIFGIEEHYAARIPGVDVPIVGYTDLILTVGERHVKIADVKTGWGNTLTPEYEFQGDLMARLFLDTFPGYRVSLAVQYPRSGVVHEWDFDDERAAKVEDRVRFTWERMKALAGGAEIVATPGKACQSCPVLRDCAVAESERHFGLTVEDEQSATTAAGLTILFDAASKALKDGLKSYVDEHGPVVGEHASAVFKTSISESIKDKAALASKIGVEAALDFLSFDGRSKKRLLKKYPEAADLIVPGKASTRFVITTTAPKDAAGDDPESLFEDGD